MPLFRFQKETEFVRLLNDTEIMHYGIIKTVIRRGGKGGAVEVLTDALPDVAFDSINAQLSAYGGRMSMDDEVADVKTMGLDTSHYIESITPQAGSSNGSTVPDDLLLKIQGNGTLFKQTRDLIFRYGCEREFTVLAGTDREDLIYLLRLRGLRSSFPILKWHEDPGVKMFVPLVDDGRCFIEQGWDFPLRKIGLYHPALSPVNLIAGNGRWWKSGNSDFAPVGDLADLKFGDEDEVISLSPVDVSSLPRSPLQLNLVQTSVGTDDEDDDRLHTLEAQRLELDNEIERLKWSLTGPAEAYRFESSELDALHKFATSYPLRFVQRFKFVPIKTNSDLVYWVFSGSAVNPVRLPKAIRKGTKSFVRIERWYRENGVQFYRPEGYQLDPPVSFSNDAAFRRLLTGEPNEQIFVVESSDGGSHPFTIPVAELLGLDEWVSYTNTVSISESEVVRRSLRESLDAALAQIPTVETDS